MTNVAAHGTTAALHENYTKNTLMQYLEQMPKPDISPSQIELRNYFPGAIGWMTELHAQYYSRYRGWGLVFEAEMATELSQFLLNFDPSRDGLWIATLNHLPVGTIAIDGNQATTEGARRG